jgi:hypothetical protein
MRVGITLLTGILAFCSSVAFASPTVQTGATTAVVATPTPNANWRDLSDFANIDPKHLVPDKPLERAMLYFNKNRSIFGNQNFVAVIDYTQGANKKRFYIINMKTGAVEQHAVAHGKGSDLNHSGFAKHFSNSGGSEASSIGFYKTGEIYHGNHGRSLRLDGLSSTNNNARGRAVVIHAAKYVTDSNASGRSWGCPAVSPGNIAHIIDTLKGGALIYAFGGQGN